MPKLQLIVTPKSGIAYHRLVNPISYLNMGEEWTCEMLWFGQEEHKIDCDILWYSKYCMTEAKFLAKYKAKGTKIIVDVDDDWDIPPDHSTYKAWIGTGRDKEVIKNIQMADVVTCSTHKLREKILPYNMNCIVLPNTFPFGLDGYKPTEQEAREKMTFLYCGGSSHYGDVKILDGKFRKIGSDPYFVKNSMFALAGYEPQMKRMYFTPQDMKAGNNNYTEMPSRGDWDKMASVFKGTNSYKIYPTIEIENYLQHYDRADVAIIPLRDTVWNGYKSNLKVLEAATRELPVICSAVSPYIDRDSHLPILWVRKPDDWITHIKWCIKNRDLAKQMGKSLAEAVNIEYNMLNWNEVRKQMLLSLIN